MSAVARADADAPFLRAAMARHPVITALLKAGDVEGALTVAKAPVDGAVRRQLRIQRDRIALVLAIGDLCGAFAFERVVGELSTFADYALGAAIDEAIRARTPGVTRPGFAAIALGKHGSNELNYSSDIDPILLYDPATVPLRPREDAAEGAVRIARAVVDLLQTRDADGYVFRVDLRLRPSSEITPLALPVNAAISHYESSALAWERAAFVRARAAAGDVALGQSFLTAIQPFVWRRSLDFGAIGELRDLSRRIRAHHAQGQTFGPGFDLKRGRGGIREIEFFVQIQQLVHGGRDRSLRLGNTLDAIGALCVAGHIPAETATMLGTAYRLFRTIEHRLQMIDDRQTHSLPTGDALDGVARLHGLNNGAALLDLLRPHVDAVGTVYDGLDGVETITAVDTASFIDSAAADRRIAEWRSGTIRALRSPSALAAMETALPGLIAALARAPDPQAALVAFDRLLNGLPSAINLFRLLDARPSLRDLLVDILSHAPTLAHALARQPALLDTLIDATAFDPVGDLPGLIEAMTVPGHLEAQLDHVRHIVGEVRFALGTQIVSAHSDPLDVAAGYARLAEAALTTVANAVVKDFAAKHGSVPASELVVMALGRLGGGMLTHASDLDLIYLFTGDFRSDSDGGKPLGASHYYNRLAQRLSAGLSAPTSVGPLYDVDTRLRPSGVQGPLCVSVDSFARYQREDAWTWEHMAMTRARPVFGSQTARMSLASCVADILAQPRDRRKLIADIVKMREDVARHKPPLGPFDVKLCAGGLVDLEFAVHFAQLSSGNGLSPDLGTAIDLLMPTLRPAHDLLTRLIVTLRLVSPTMEAPPEVTRPLVARACGAADWEDLLVRLADARHSVSEAWAHFTTENR